MTLDVQMAEHASLPNTLNCALIDGVLFSGLPEIQRLVGQGADVNGFDVNGLSPLHYAAQQNLGEKAAFLLDHGADPNSVTTTNELGLNECLTPLLIVSSSRLIDDKLPMMSLLMGRGADPNIPDVDGMASLVKLIVGGSPVHELEFLYSKGADLSAADQDGNSALVHAYESGDFRAIDFLRAHHASEAGVPEYELICCAGRGELESVISALERGANPNHIFNHTALCAAAEAGCFEVVQCLLASGVNSDLRRSNQEFTPLIAAAYNGHLDVVRSLLQHGADPQCEVEDMGTALDFARLGRQEGLNPTAPWKEMITCLKS